MNNDVDIDLLWIIEYASPGTTDVRQTDTQREALLVALVVGDFEEPWGASLSDVATDLGISQPAAGGFLRRGIKWLILSVLTDDD
jgi:predicted DNA binding protein